jgi:hypothetical protein
MVLGKLELVWKNCGKIVKSRLMGGWVDGWNHIFSGLGVKLISRIAFSNQKVVVSVLYNLDYSCQKNAI